MKNFKIVLLLIIPLLFILTPRLTFVEATQTLFTDNFDSNQEGSFPSGWELVRDSGQQCNANWKVHNGMAGIAINQESCTTNIMPTDEKWNKIGNNYIFEADMKFVNGTDHNIVFRYIPFPSLGIAEIHFQSPGDFSVSVPVKNYDTFIPGSYPNGNIYHIKTIINKKNIKIYINSLLVRDITLTQELPSGRIALRAGAGGDPVSETWFDNIVVSSLDDVTDLDVPLLKQTDPAWGSQEYDSANIWSPASPGISSWGCAMTSAAMVFNYHGITKLPDGIKLDPGTLNNWLKNQPDGYVGGGLVNWLALSRLSKLAKLQNPLFSFGALEYRHVAGSDTAQLKKDIEQKIPDILEEKGHFIVGKGINNNSFSINDPFYDRTDLASYSGTFLSLGRFLPSNTDLSYIMLTTDINTNITVTDANGFPVGESFIQQPIFNALTGESGASSRIFYLPRPQGSKFHVSLSSGLNHAYSLKAFLYDKSGAVKVLSLEGLLSSKDPESFTIDFNNANVQKTSFERVVTFQSAIADVLEARNSQLIRSNGVAQSLIRLLENADRRRGIGRKYIVFRLLDSFEVLLKMTHGRIIQEEAYQILLYDAEYLGAHL